MTRALPLIALIALTACDAGDDAEAARGADAEPCGETPCPDGYACFDGQCIFQGAAAPDAPPDPVDPAPPEAEIDLDPTPPAAGRDHVWVTAPHSDAIVRIHGTTLRVTLIEVGDDPHAIRTVPGQDTAIVLARGEDRLIVARHDPATDTDALTRHDLPGHFNALALDPAGRYAYAWFDLTAARPGEDVAALQDTAVLDLDTGALYPVTVGFTPRRIDFAADGAALVITDDGVSIIRPATLDGPAIAPTIPLAPDVFRQADREVVLTPDGRYAASRGPGEDGITLVDLTEGIPRYVPLGAEPTDLDLVPDGRALVMLRDARRLALVPLDDPDGRIETRAYAAPLGSATVSPRGDRAILYATRLDAPPAAALLALDTLDLVRLPLRKRALGAAIDPDGDTAIVLHAAEPATLDPPPAPDAGPPDADLPDADPLDAGLPDLDPLDADPLDADLPDADPLDADPLDLDPPDRDPADSPFQAPPIDPELAEHPGYSLVDLDTAFVKLTLTPALVTALIYTPGAAFLTLHRAPDTAELHRVDLTRFDARRHPLGSPPETLGRLAAIDRIFVTQAHPTGRITFAPLDADRAPETVTGFALNGRIE